MRLEDTLDRGEEVTRRGRGRRDAGVETAEEVVVAEVAVAVGRAVDRDRERYDGDAVRLGDRGRRRRGPVDDDPDRHPGAPASSAIAAGRSFHSWTASELISTSTPALNITTRSDCRSPTTGH